MEQQNQQQSNQQLVQISLDEARRERSKRIKIFFLVAFVAVAITVGGILLWQQSQKNNLLEEQQSRQKGSNEKVSPMLVWYQPTELSPNVVAKSGVNFDRNSRGLDVDYWCAIDEAVLDGGFRIRQRPLRGNPSDALLKGQMEFVERQKENNEVEIFERVKVGSFDGYYVKLRLDGLKGIQDAQILAWGSGETYVKVSADSWCRTIEGNELSRGEILKIAQSMVQNPIEIFEPQYLPEGVRRNSLTWSEPEPIVTEDLEKLLLHVDVSSQKKGVRFEYACKQENDFIVIQSRISEDDRDLGLMQLVEKTAGNGLRGSLKAAETVTINGVPGIFVWNKEIVPVQRLWWRDNLFLFTIVSQDENCSSTKEELLKTAELLTPIPDTYFIAQKPPKVDETTLGHLPILQKIQTERQGPSPNPENWPLYTSVSRGSRYQINIHPDFSQLYGPGAGWQLSDKSFNPITIAGFSVGVIPPIETFDINNPDNAWLQREESRKSYTREAEFYKNIYTLLSSKPIGEIYDATSGNTYIKIKEIMFGECKAQEYMVKFDEEEFEKLKREGALYGDLIRRYQEARNMFTVCVEKNIVFYSHFNADNEEIFNKYKDSFDASLSTFRLFKQ